MVLPLPVLQLVATRSSLRARTEIEPVARQLGIWSRVRDCGRLVAGERGGSTVIEPRRCKARGCPACDRTRSWRQGRDLARHAARLGGVLVLATLVRTGSPRESALEAVRATLDALRRVSASRASRWPPMIATTRWPARAATSPRRSRSTATPAKRCAGASSGPAPGRGRAGRARARVGVGSRTSARRANSSSKPGRRPAVSRLEPRRMRTRTVVPCPGVDVKSMRPFQRPVRAG